MPNVAKCQPLLERCITLNTAAYNCMPCTLQHTLKQHLVPYRFRVIPTELQIYSYQFYVMK